jgi:hypothetical protein
MRNWWNKQSVVQNVPKIERRAENICRKLQVVNTTYYTVVVAFKYQPRTLRLLDYNDILPARDEKQTGLSMAGQQPHSNPAMRL